MNDPLLRHQRRVTSTFDEYCTGCNWASWGLPSAKKPKRFEDHLAKTCHTCGGYDRCPCPR